VSLDRQVDNPRRIADRWPREEPAAEWIEAQGRDRSRERDTVELLALVAIHHCQARHVAAGDVDAMTGWREGEGSRGIGESHERGIAPAEGIVKRHARIAGDGDEIAPARGRDITACGDRPKCRGLIGGGDEQLVLWDDADQMLVGRAEEVAWERGERLRPGEARPARKRDHMPR